MQKNWIIKAIYPSGGHTVMFNDGSLRFVDKQAAMDRAETLNSVTRESDERNNRANTTRYIVVEEEM